MAPSIARHDEVVWCNGNCVEVPSGTFDVGGQVQAVIRLAGPVMPNWRQALTDASIRVEFWCPPFGAVVQLHGEQTALRALSFIAGAVAIRRRFAAARPRWRSMRIGTPAAARTGWSIWFASTGRPGKRSPTRSLAWASRLLRRHRSSCAYAIAMPLPSGLFQPSEWPAIIRKRQLGRSCFHSARVPRFAFSSSVNATGPTSQIEQAARMTSDHDFLDGWDDGHAPPLNIFNIMQQSAI